MILKEEGKLTKVFHAADGRQNIFEKRGEGLVKTLRWYSAGSQGFL